MENTGDRDLFGWARGSERRKVEPKFPAAVLLDTRGNKVEPEVLFSPNDSDLARYRDRLGCPCCDAKLKWTPEKEKILGSRPRKGFFSSFDLGDHVDCDLASADDKLSKRTRDRLEFFTQGGPKVLYWNIPYKHMTPVFEEAASPLKDITNVIRTGLEEGDAPVSYQVSSMQEFLELTKHKAFDDSFWDDVVIYDEEHRISWRDFVFNADQDRFLKTTFDQAEKGASQPKVVMVEIAPIEHKDVKAHPYNPGTRVAFDIDRGLYTIEADVYDLEADDDGISFRSQIILQTNSNDVFNDIIEASKSGQPIALHGVASNTPQEIKNVRSRWPNRECPNNNLRTYLYLSTSKDIGVVSEPSVGNELSHDYDNNLGLE